MEKMKGLPPIVWIFPSSNYFLPATGHRVARVDSEIENDRFELAWVGFDASVVGVRKCFQFKAFADDAAEQLFHFDHEFIEIDHLGVKDLFAAESQELSCKRGCLITSLPNQ